MTIATITVEEPDRGGFDTSSSMMNGKGMYGLGRSSGSHSKSHHSSHLSSDIVISIKRENIARHAAQSPSRREHAVILRWNRYYKYWWGFLFICVSFTALFDRYARLDSLVRSCSQWERRSNGKALKGRGENLYERKASCINSMPSHLRRKCHYPT
mmetsp:Transcript_457/g.668  ORF Transcript_457/g.668 Transcript_457/m.668 type:complete len:156 (-) Transcript_457:114-581(-)